MSEPTRDRWAIPPGPTAGDVHGDRVALGYPGKVVVLDLAMGATFLEATPRDPGPVTALAVTDRWLVATAGTAVDLWSLGTGHRHDVHAARSAPTRALSVDPERSRLALIDDHGGLAVVDLTSGRDWPPLGPPTPRARTRRAPPPKPGGAAEAQPDTAHLPEHAPPDAARELVDEGRALYREGKVRDAEKKFAKALKLDPQWGEAALRLGLAREDDRNFAGAVEAYDRCLQIDAFAYQAATNLAEVLRKSERYGAAVRAYNRALAVHASAPGVHRPGEYLYALAGRAEAKRMMGQYDAALDDFERALDVGPTHQFAIQGYAATLNARGDFAEALPWWRLAVQLQPQSGFARAGLALCERGPEYPGGPCRAAEWTSDGRLVARYPEVTVAWEVERGAAVAHADDPLPGTRLPSDGAELSWDGTWVWSRAGRAALPGAPLAGWHGRVLIALGPSLLAFSPTWTAAPE